MTRWKNRKRLIRVSCCAAACYLIILAVPAAEAQPEERTSVNVVVRDAESGQPINQARLTLQFREPGKKLTPKLPHRLAYSAKTNAQGRYRFADIPKGTIRIMVTAEQHQAFGKDFELERDNQVIEVKLRKPQPLL